MPESERAIHQAGRSQRDPAQDFRHEGGDVADQVLAEDVQPGAVYDRFIGSQDQFGGDPGNYRHHLGDRDCEGLEPLRDQFANAFEHGQAQWIGGIQAVVDGISQR